MPTCDVQIWLGIGRAIAVLVHLGFRACEDALMHRKPTGRYRRPDASQWSRSGATTWRSRPILPFSC